jgi:hypothetical protein
LRPTAGHKPSYFLVRKENRRLPNPKQMHCFASIIE